VLRQTRRAAGIWRATCVWLLLGALTASRVDAQDAASSVEPAGYRAAIDEGVQEFGAQNYEEARAHFHQAHELLPNARTFRALGMVAYELRSYVECIRNLEGALSSGVKPLTPELKAETERTLARANKLVARFQIDAKPSASRVLVDGLQVELPDGQPLLLQVGDYTLQLEAPGYAPEMRKLSVQGGERDTLTVVFTRKLAMEAPTKPGRRWYKNPWLWGSVGVVLVGAAAGTGIALTRDEKTAHAYGGNADAVLKGP
jgi:tetratricopeptide (TPR) repeat protein